MQLTESQVIDSDRDTDPLSFRDIVERHKRSIYYLALNLTRNHHDAEDLSQEVFIKAFRSLDQFRGDAQVRTWLYRITVNTYLNTKRKKVLAFMELQDDMSDERFEREVADPADLPVESSSIKSHVEQALNQLSPRERSAFVLRHYNDLSVKEIAAMLDLAEGTVKSLLFRSVQKLQKVLGFYKQDLGLM